jgi:hypothetical protein
VPRVTEKMLLGAHREYLDKEFAQKYPRGRYCVQRWKYNGLHWCPKRSTSATKFAGVTVVDHDRYLNPGIQVERWQNNNFGKCTTYDSLDKMIAAARRFGFSEELISTFLGEYNKHEHV